MKFYEASLRLEVSPELAKVYAKAIEDSESRYWTENVVTDKDGNVISDKPKVVWRGNYCTCEYDRARNSLYITLISRTLPNLQDSVAEYQQMGAELMSNNWEE